MLHAFGTYPFHDFHSIHDTRSSRLFQTSHGGIIQSWYPLLQLNR
jgi:hypothetical protein